MRIKQTSKEYHDTQTTCLNRIALRAGEKGAGPAEIRALALVFEKSATEIKLNKNY